MLSNLGVHIIMATITSTGYKATLTYDAAGLPTGVSGVAAATIVDGLMSPVTALTSPDVVLVGMPRTVGVVTSLFLGAVIGSKYSGGGWIPARAI